MLRNSCKLYFPPMILRSIQKSIHYKLGVGSTLKNYSTEYRNGISSDEIFKNSLFSFTGQGSQWPGMGKDIYYSYSKFVKDIFDEASESIQLDLKKIMFDGTQIDIRPTSIAQPCIVTHSIACLDILKRILDVDPIVEYSNFALGHSVGEITALYACKSLSLSDAVRFARNRGLIMEKSISEKKSCFSMAVFAPLSSDAARTLVNIVQSKFDSYALDIAAYNSPLSVVLSGTEEAVEDAKMIFREGFQSEDNKIHRGRAMKLDVSGAFHTKFFENCEKDIKTFLKNEVLVNDATVPIISNLVALPMHKSCDIIENISLATSKPVRFCDCLEYVKNQKTQELPFFVEIGPKSFLVPLAKQNKFDSTLYLGSQKDLESLFSKIK